MSRSAISAGMNVFAQILSDLQAAIAARAARDRSLTVLLVALWGRVARMGARLDRLIRLWRAGKLPAAGRSRVGRAGAAGRTPRAQFPTGSGWLLRRLGYEVAAYGSQLQHALTDAECQAFLAACPRAGRIFRPLLRMLTVDALPEVVRRARVVVAAARPVAEMVGVVGRPVVRIFSA